jgi:hypothetical protein
MLYPFVDGKVKAVSLHRQVCIAFHGDPAPGQVARHLDDVSANNRADNLAWGTRAENAADARRNGIGRPTVRARTHCKQGHPWTEENTGRTGSGYRRCRACTRVTHN